MAVLEAGRVVGQASGRNGGHVDNGTAHNFASLAGMLGLDHARRLCRPFDDAVDTVERIARELPIYRYAVVEGVKDTLVGLMPNVNVRQNTWNMTDRYRAG
ncbi:hypothetical protein JMJ56_17805 [Belnapia sp. T18]|uniref:FAD dependent oxidoreductase n=1 Tax=Belnapia arida TaxID=2804533 RepID=A0ABS1U599_9PROT|nr:hypothetical protein [Belnapia arida]MBL6079877.1 hypothetical protein [Belnapia arida]